MSPKSRWPWISLILLQGIQLLTLAPWLALAGLAVMAFDAPGSGQMWGPRMFVLAIWSYPVWLALAAAGSWLLCRAGWNVSAVVLAGIFTLPMPLAVLYIFAADLVN